MIANSDPQSSDVPDDYVVVRGGTKPLPPIGEPFSGSAGPDKYDAGKGIPHGQLRATTARLIRDLGGSVMFKPEMSAGHVLNSRHVEIIEGAAGAFGKVEPNPVPKTERIK